MGQVLSYVDMFLGDNYDRFSVEWWTLIKRKREGK
jgi:hypothetical protein